VVRASSSASGDGDNAVEEELEVVMGHHGLGAPGQVSIPEAVDTALFALHQVQDMLQQERRGLDEEWQCLVKWGSPLKKRTTFEKEKVVKKRVWLNKMEVVLKQEEIAIGLLNIEAEEPMEKGKELYATTRARADANIKA
jgi:hypothetical protein